MIAAVDCDMRRVYAMRSDGVLLYKAHADPVGAAFDGCAYVLFEIASAKDYRQTNQAAAYATRRWMLWNIACAQRLAMTMPRNATMLVSPSSAWTKGYNLAQRHKLADCKQPQKDLRETEAMIAFYRRDPSPWVPLTTYLEDL